MPPLPSTFDYRPPPGLDILYEDERLIVCNKPSGLLTVPGKDISLADCLEVRVQARRPEFPATKVVHRLDKDTSGIILLAYDKKALGSLGSQFEHRKVEKYYVARVWGEVEGDSGETTVSVENARRIHAEADAEGLLRVVAYAEAMAVLLAGLDVHVGVPEALVRQALDDTLTGTFPWSPILGGVCAHLERHVRSRLSSALLAAGRQRGRLRDPWAARLARAQVGDLRGLELVAHHAGEMAATFRRGDRDVRLTAERLAAEKFVGCRIRPVP